MNSANLTQAGDGRPAVDSGLTDFRRLYAVRGQYQLADTNQTLGEGLREYYEVNSGLVDPVTMDDQFSARYFRCHDITHVIFGTHTGPLDEGVNDLYTMFGVDVSYARYLMGFFKTSASKDVAKEYQAIRRSEVLRSSFGTIRILPRVWRSCRRMHKKWPWQPPEGSLERPLAELRAEYGIELWRAEEALGFG